MNVGEGQTECYWIEPTERVRLSLRRFTFAVDSRGEMRAHRNCPGTTWGHNATADLGVEIPFVVETSEDGWKHMGPVPDEHCPPRDDPRWPQVCAKCGEPFRADDEWQVNQAEVYVKPDGTEVAFRGYSDITMAGALFDCWWLHGRRSIRDGVEHRYVGPDGIALVAVCPNGASWEVDGPSSGGGHWQRTGDPRNPPSLTVSPSIIAGDYHGFLQNGIFTAHIG